jgi:hypothetical protein
MVCWICTSCDRDADLVARSSLAFQGGASQIVGAFEPSGEIDGRLLTLRGARRLLRRLLTDRA